MSYYFSKYLNENPSPNEIYEIDPDFISSNDQLTFLVNNFGPEHAKYIYTQSRKWVETVLKNIDNNSKNLPQSIKTRILTNAINTLRPTNKAKSSVIWPDTNSQVSANDNVYNYYKISSSDSEGSIYGLDLASNQYRLHNTTQKYIISTALKDDQLASLTSLIYPILKLNTSFYYIDRYFELFRSNNSYKNMLHEIFKTLADKPIASNFNIVTAVEDNTRVRFDNISDFINKFRNEYAVYLKKNVTVNLYIYKGENIDLHDRFFFGNKIGGWGCGRGLRPSHHDTQALSFYSLTSPFIEEIKNNFINSPNLIFAFGDTCITFQA